MSFLQTVKLGSKKVFIHWHDAFDPTKHPQAPKGAPEGKGGQFVKVGTGGTTGKSGETPASQSEPKATSESPKHAPELVEVGGDQWNKDTAKRLADEYHNARPELDKIRDDIVKSGPLAEEEEQYDWVKRELKQEKWDDLKDDVRDEVKNDWLESHWDETYKDNKDISDKLSEDQISQMTLNILSKIWEHMKADKKYDYASTHHPMVIKQEEEARKVFLGEPDKYDPLNHPLSEAEDSEKARINYQKTQSIARKMSLDRAYDLIMQRKVKDTEGWGERSFQDLRDDIARTDDELWGSWKASSTSKDGLLIQVAAAEELGGRLRGIDKDEIKHHADLNYSTVGGYDGIKAMMRAKWETSQYLLEKAGIDKVEVYRGLDLEEADDQPRQKVRSTYTGKVTARGNVTPEQEYTLLSDVNILRNGAASTSLSYDVSNEWDGSNHRVVLRIAAPRTAVLSLPAYGVNETSEREVVLAGTAWTAWDAWAGKSAPIEAVPIGEAKGEPADLPIVTQLKKALEDEEFQIYDYSKTKEAVIEGEYNKSWYDDPMYISFKWHPATKEGEVTVAPDSHKEESETFKVSGEDGIQKLIDHARLAKASKHPMIKSAVDKLANTGYVLENRTGDVFWFTGYDGSTVSINHELKPDGTVALGGAAWRAYGPQGFALEQGNNMKDLPKFLSKQAHSKAA